MQKKLHPLTIQDEFTHLNISRQQKLQMRRVRDGRCATCGEAREAGLLQRCRSCLDKDAARHRRRYARVIV